MKFFAEYCEPCRRALPQAQSLHQAYPDVAFIGVSVDPRKDSARALIARFGLTFPVVHDGDDALRKRFEVLEVPITFVADPCGVVRWVGGPGKTEAELVQAIEAARLVTASRQRADCRNAW